MGHSQTHTPTHDPTGAKSTAWTNEEDAADRSAGVLLCAVAHIAREIRLPMVAAACSCILSVAWSGLAKDARVAYLRHEQAAEPDQSVSDARLALRPRIEAQAQARIRGAVSSGRVSHGI